MALRFDMSVVERFRPRTRTAWAALIGLAGYFVTDLLGWGLFRFLFGMIAVVAFVLLGFRLVGYVRRILLWRLRNRLLVTYLFISVIPIGLIVIMVGLSAYLLYGQLAAYLIASDLEALAARLGAINRSVAAGLASGRTAGNPEDLVRFLERERAALSPEFRDARLTLVSGDQSWQAPAGDAEVSCRELPAWVEEEFHGLITVEGHLFLHSVIQDSGQPGRLSCLTVPVTGELLGHVGQDAGPFNLILLEEVRGASGGLQIGLQDRNFTLGLRLDAAGRVLPPPGYTVDPTISFVSTFQVVFWDPANPERTDDPVWLDVTTRASLLNRRIFAPLEELSQIYLVVLAIIGVLVLIVQFVSVVTGVRLTRSITYAVHELYGLTERVQGGDFSVRVRTKREDQLGALCDSFNQMAGSIEGLIEESKARQRLENEVEIASQVQEQLFPREVPLLNTMRIAGRCLPARGVGGDYYDYGLSSPGKLIFTIGDISGKGISAALLMATIQSLMRSQIYASTLMGQMDALSVAELVARVNRQLCATTSQEKYSTLFTAFYNDETRQLTYTNAGHLPPMLLQNGSVETLGVGGAVVGLFSDLRYEQATVTLEPGGCLVAYTDGISESENSYEEDYGEQRLQEFLQRRFRGTRPDRLIDAIFEEIEEWSPGAEASDDRTLLVAQAV